MMKGKDLFWCIACMALSTGIAYIFSMLGFTDANLVMIYIVGVLAVALKTGGYTWSVATSVLAVLTFNFFFAEPIFTFAVNNPNYIITFIVMLATSITCSVLTKRIAIYAEESGRRSYRAELLLETSRSLQDASESDEILQKTVEQLGRLLEKNIYCLVGHPENGKKPLYYRCNDDISPLNKEDRATAIWCFENGEDAGPTTNILRESRYLYLTAKGEQETFAVFLIDMKGYEIGTFELGITGTIIHECVFALEKEKLRDKKKEAEMKLEKEQLRANLLRSISHDLRSPLTSISGNAENLIQNDWKFTDEKRHAIYEDIYDDSKWLINLVENLLSITRIENGTVELDIQAEMADEVIEEAIKHVNFRGKNQSIHIECEDFLMAKMDVKLMLQVLINLMDNAVKYTPEDACITVSAREDESKVIFAVKDNGIGLTADQKKKIFDMYYTVNRGIGDARRGIGLGLPLCQAILKAHGSVLTVRDNESGGSIFEFALEKEEIALW